MSNEKKSEWIFVAHSNLDYDKVCRVRNEFERYGHKPILFYLKCLNETPDQLIDLLKREISARKWFILCNSENARKSPIVQEEVAYIKSLDKEKYYYEEIDLDGPWKQQKAGIHRLSKGNKSLLSFCE